MSDGYSVVRVTEVESPYGVPTNARSHLLRRALDVQAFGINAWTSREAGQTVIGEHDETAAGHEEVYVVLSGHATFTVDGETVDAPQGTVVFVRDPAVKRTAVGDVADTTILVVGAKRGVAFVVSNWEAAADALRFRGMGQGDRGARGRAGQGSRAGGHQLQPRVRGESRGQAGRRRSTSRTGNRAPVELRGNGQDGSRF